MRVHASRLILVLTLAAALGAGVLAQTTGQPRRYSAVAIDLDRGRTSRIQISVSRWSTGAERDQLMRTMMDKGPEALLDTLQRLPSVGRIQVNQGLGWDLHFAWTTPGEDGGDRVILATDRPMSFWETVNRPRTVDYPFTIIEMHMKDGQGDGTLSFATKIIPNKEQNIVVLENYDMQRTRLSQVKEERR